MAINPLVCLGLLTSATAPDTILKSVQDAALGVIRATARPETLTAVVERASLGFDQSPAKWVVDGDFARFIGRGDVYVTYHIPTGRICSYDLLIGQAARKDAADLPPLTVEQAKAKAEQYLKSNTPSGWSWFLAPSGPMTTPDGIGFMASVYHADTPLESSFGTQIEIDPTTGVITHLDQRVIRFPAIDGETTQPTPKLLRRATLDGASKFLASGSIRRFWIGGAHSMFVNSSLGESASATKTAVSRGFRVKQVLKMQIVGYNRMGQPAAIDIYYSPRTLKCLSFTDYTGTINSLSPQQGSLNKPVDFDHTSWTLTLEPSEKPFKLSRTSLTDKLQNDGDCVLSNTDGVGLLFHLDASKHLLWQEGADNTEAWTVPSSRWSELSASARKLRKLRAGVVSAKSDNH